MEAVKLLADLKNIAGEQGLPVMGAAILDGDMKTLQLEGVTDTLKMALVFGFPLSRAVLNTVKDGPNQLYFHHYRQANYLLDRVALRIGYELEEKGFRAIPVAASQVIGWEDQQGHVSHKELAIKAGLGWKGRNNLLVHPEYGSRLRLVSVLTDLPVDAAPLLQEFKCGGCSACMNICPAGAIKEDPADFEHVSCFEMLKEFKRQGRTSQYICGLCVKVCPGKKDAGNKSQINNRG